MTVEQADFYSLPRIYDVLHTPGTADEVDGLERIARLFAPAAVRPRGASRKEPGPVWLEPACGTGRYLRLLHRRGYRAVGFDISPDMVAYALDGLGPGAPTPRGIKGSMSPGKGRFKASAKSGSEPWPASAGDSPLAHSTVFVADMTSFDRAIPGLRVDFAFNLINTIRHLESDAQMLDHFSAMARVMTPDAVYAVGISLTAYGLEDDDEDVWKARRGSTRVTQVVQYLPPRETRGPAARDERVISHLTVIEGAAARDINSAYTLRTYSLAQWKAIIGASPLRLAAVVDEYGNEARPAEPGYAIYLLKRKDDPRPRVPIRS